MRRTVIWMTVLVLAAVPLAAWAQEKAVEKSHVVLTWEEFVKITGYEPNKKSQVLTIPWSEVEALLDVKVDKVGQGTTLELPWNEFKALMEWSMKRKEKPEEKPPADFIVSSSGYTGTLSDEKGEFELKVKIDVLEKKGWKRIPVLPIDVAVTAATLPAGVYLNARGNMYELLVTEAKPIDVTIKFSAAATKSAGVHRIDFQRVLPGSSVVDLTVEGTDVEVKLANAQASTTQKQQNTTKVLAAIPGNVPMSISWQREIPKAPPAPAKLYAETHTLVAVAEGMLLCTEVIDYNILHSGVRELKLRVPAGTSVMTVSGRSTEDWRVTPAGEMTVVLRGEVTGPYSLQVTYEAQVSGASVEVPVIRTVGIERERGHIGVVAIANAELSSGNVTGAGALDVRRLPAQLVGMTNQPILLGYRYTVDRFSIPLNIKRHGELEVLVTIVDGASFTAMQLSDGRRITRAIYQVRNNRNQFLRMQMPEGADIWSVSVNGKPASPAKDEAGQILVPLVRSRTGTSELASFPVELVYVETPAEAPKANGTLHVEMPTLAVPIMHMMYTWYLPAEGYYPPVAARTLFKGTLRPTEGFTTLAATPQGQVVYLDANKQADDLQQEVTQRFQRQAAEAGTTAIRVRLPLDGKQYRFERILVLPKDKLWIEMSYNNWRVD